MLTVMPYSKKRALDNYFYRRDDDLGYEARLLSELYVRNEGCQLTRGLSKSSRDIPHGSRYFRSDRRRPRAFSSPLCILRCSPVISWEVYKMPLRPVFILSPVRDPND